jgi:hypothetical protein
MRTIGIIEAKLRHTEEMLRSHSDQVVYYSLRLQELKKELKELESPKLTVGMLRDKYLGVVRNSGKYMFVRTLTSASFVRASTKGFLSSWTTESFSCLDDEDIVLEFAVEKVINEHTKYKLFDDIMSLYKWLAEPV